MNVRYGRNQAEVPRLTRRPRREDGRGLQCGCDAPRPCAIRLYMHNNAFVKTGRYAGASA